MNWRFLVSLLIGLLVLCSAIIWWVISLPKVDIPADQPEASVAAGEQLFWSRARCHLCHRIGDRGYALRGPNLGEGRDGALIGVRASERARLQGLQNGVDYLMQSLAEPGAFVVSGYRNEMPEVFKPPIRLSPSEIKAIVLYLNSLGGQHEVTDVPVGEKILTYYKKAAAAIARQVTGDVARGQQLFFDTAAGPGCAKCHVARDLAGIVRGERIGPDLTAVGSFRSPEHLYSKIVDPDSNLVSGYEQLTVITRAGTQISGLLHAETDDSLTLVDALGVKTTYPKNSITSRAMHPLSIMPGNYQDLLSETEIEDLLAYLVSLQDYDK